MLYIVHTVVRMCTYMFASWFPQLALALAWFLQPSAQLGLSS